MNNADCHSGRRLASTVTEPLFRSPTTEIRTTISPSNFNKDGKNPISLNRCGASHCKACEGAEMDGNGNGIVGYLWEMNRGFANFCGRIQGVKGDEGLGLKREQERPLVK
jgi:hypothetical protein